MRVFVSLLLVLAAFGCSTTPPVTASQVVEAFTEAGLPAPNPRDVTNSECGEAGCEEAVATDVVTVLRWSDAAAAREHSAALQQPAYAVNQFVIAFPVGTDIATNEYADVATAAVRASEQ